MNIHNYSVSSLLLRMLRNPQVSREEIIDFVLKSDLVSPEKVVEFLESYEQKHPYNLDAELKGEPIDPESEGIIPLDRIDN